MKKTIFVFLSGCILYSCGSNNESKSSNEVVSTIEAPAETPEEAAAIKKQLAEEAASITTMKFDKMEHNFGTIKAGSENDCEFIVTNTGTKPLLIEDVKASCGCTTPQKPEGPIQPGKSDVIKVHFKPNGPNPTEKKTVTVTANTEPRLQIVNIVANVTK